MSKLTIFLLCLASACAQSDCRDVQEGVFYFFPKGSTKKFVVIRNGPVQKEVEVNTSDTSYWKIDWRTDCNFTLEFSKRPAGSAEDNSLYRSHKIAVEILNVTKDYYSFRAGVDSISSSSLVDTLWMKEK
jgi:hypothetical protein